MEFLTELGNDPRSLAILAIGVICWRITRERPSRHAAVALCIFFAGFSLFAIWKFAPSYNPAGPVAEIEHRAFDVLWRQMEIYVWGVHVAALLYLTGYFLRESEVYAKGIIGILWVAEAVSLATDNTLCRFVFETPGSELVETLMRTGSTPEACEIHWPAAAWLPYTVWAFVLLYALWLYQRAKRKMT